ncbi:Cadherin-86C, partial [Melipona quadrifasciata]
RMPFAGEWCKVWIYFGFVFAWAKGARPRFDTSADMRLVLVPADATITPVVRIDNLPCTLYNKVCQANVILTKRLVAGRFHDFAVRVRDTKGDSNSMQATISVTNATTPRDKIFPHIPSLIMVPEDTKPGKELDYLLARANSWSGKPVYIELWQPKELFTIRQRQTPTQTRGIIVLTGELDFETQSMYTLTIYATDPYTEQGKDTRNIAGLSVVVIVRDVQDVPPIFTLAPPLTKINNSVQPGDIVLRVHAEDGDKGVPREIVYGLVSEGNPFTPFFNISETNGEISLARPLEELTQITHVGAPVVLTVVAEEIRRSREEPPAQATVVDVGFLLGEPGNSPPYFESDKLVPETYIATIDENPEPGTVINFGEQYSTRVKDEDIGKAGVFALKLENNNNTFEISPTVAERAADFVVTVRDNAFIDYERYKVLSFKIVAQEVGPATNLSASVPATVYLRDVNDNPPIFDEVSYEVTLSENVTAGSRVIQVHATDKDTGVYGSIRYTSITGEGSEAFTMDSQTGYITVAMGSSLDREVAATLVLTVEARDENGNGNSGVVPLIVNLIDVNDNAPRFEKDVYDFMLNSDLTNFTSPALVKAIDDDAEPPNNVVRYELIHGNYENKFYLNETSGELTLLSPITKIRRKKQSSYEKRVATKFTKDQRETQNDLSTVTANVDVDESSTNNRNLTKETTTEVAKKRRRRADDPDALYTLTARAYDLGVPHLSSVAKIRILSGAAMEARIMMFVVPGEQPDSTKTAETLAAITGGRVTVLETRPYVQQNYTGNAGILHGGGKKSIIVARVEQTEPGTPLVDVEKIREALAANGVGIIGGNAIMNATVHVENTNPPPVDETPRVNDGQTTLVNNTVTTVHSEEVTVYKAENKLLMWLLIILGLLMLLAIAALIVCCICPGCPFYMAPRKRRVHSSETLVVRSDGRPKRHLHRQPAIAAEVSWNGRKQAWSADPTRRNWQFNKRNVKNCSLPGDVAYVTSELRQPSGFQMTVEAQQRPRDGASRYDHSRRSRLNEQERMYMEDVEEQKARRGYRTAELDSLQRHEVERGSDLQHQAYRQRFMEPDVNVEEPTVREQHFYREGNAEVLRLVTRGQLEDTSHLHRQASHHHRPTALIVDGKDIILQRFIEDQKSRHELSMQDIEAARSMESHQRSKEVCQQQQPPEIILIPERLDHHGRHRQHQLSSLEEIGPTVQRLVIDHGDYGAQKTIERESETREKQESVDAPIADKPPIPDVPVKEQRVQPPDDARYSFHDLELARQNALLTRLLLERESRRAGGGGMDSTSYLETQSLPGQVAIATQTDRTAATQTEHQAKSRSDNDESDNEESRHRRRLKSRKRYGEGDWRRCRAPWTKSSPIEKEARRSPCFDKRLSILRKKVREVKEGRKISLEPGVLREISDSLDGNGSSCKGEQDERTRRSYQRTEQTSISYKILNEKKSDSQSSEEKRRKSCEDDRKANATGDRSASSSEVKVQRERREKSPRKEARSKKTQRRSDGATKPSFRILEKEFTLLTKKLSKLGERRKFQESTGSTDEKSERSFAKKTDSSSSRKQTAEQGKGKQGKDSAIAKTKQKLKYQQSHQVMSTGSSELDDGLDKPKKSIAKQQRQPIGVQSHAKVKRQAQIDRRESKRQSTLPEYRDEEVDTPRPEPKSDKLGKTTTRAPKLAVVSRKQNVSEETSTSATEEKKDGGGTFPARDLASKKSSTDLSEGDSNASNRRGDFTTRRREAETLPRKIIPQRFSDDFVEEPKAEVSAVTDERETKSDATGQVSENEPGTLDSFDKLAERLSKDASTKGTIDDQLITGSTKKETRTARDRWIGKTSWGIESTESIRHADMVMEKEEIAQTDKSMSEAERDVARRVQRGYKAKDESLDEEFEITVADGRLKEKKREEEKMRKLSKDLARQSVALEGLDETEATCKARETPAGEKSAYISPDYVDGDKEIMLDVEDKVDVKEERKREPEVKDHMRKEEERTKKMKEPSEKYVETEISSDGTTGDSEVCRKKEVEVGETDREEEKQIRHAKDVSTLDYVATEEKKIEFNVRDEGKIDLDAIKVPYEHEKETHDGKVERDVLSDEWEKHEDEDVEKMKSTFGDKDKSIGDEKKEVVARDTAEDSEETTVETTGDQKFDKVTEDQKFDEETLENIATDSTRDRQVTEDLKTDEKVMEESRISKEATADKKISEETTKETRNGDKVAGELPAERETVETAEEEQSAPEKKGYQTAEGTSSEDDAGIVAKAIDFVEREKTFDEEKKIRTETDTERETVFSNKVKRSDTPGVRSDDQETSLDGEGFGEESQKKRSSPDGEGICTKKGEQIVTGDREVSKGDVSTGKEEEMVILEKEEASREKEEKEASAIEDKEEKMTEKASDHRIREKETRKGARETDEDRVSDEKIADIAQQLLTEEKDDASTIRRDKREKDDSLKMSTSHREKQDGEETKVLMETPASISDDVKEEAPMEAETPAPDDHSKRDSVFLEAFKTVHSLVDTLTNGKTPSPETEAAASEQSLPDEKELSSCREREKPSTSRVNGDSATSLDQEKVKEDAGEGKSIDSRDSNKLTTGPTKEKSDEKGPVLTDEREISESLKDDETKDTDGEKLREEKPAEEVVEDNETADEKLAGTTEKEEDWSPGEASGGGTRPQTYATEEKEKFAPDSIISEVRTDSGGTSESGKQLKLESEQTELQEVEQFVGGETFAATEATFPEKWPSMTVSDVPGTTGWESDNKHDLIVLRMDKTSLAKEDEEERPGVFLEGQSTDVSLPLFTSAIDTVDDSEDDSDSSSDVSRKTTLTTRPYQTPRHRARRLSETENNRVEEPTEARSIEDEGKEATVSIGEAEDEDSFRIIEGTNVERSSPTKPSEEDKETEELASREKDTEDGETAVTNTEKEEQFECDSATDKGSSTAGKDEPLKDSRVKPGIKADGQDGPSALASKLAQTETFRVIDKRAKELGRKRVVPQRKKKSSSEESLEEKAAGHRTRGKLAQDQPRQKEQSVDRTKQSGKRDERKQSLSRLKAEREKKSSSSSEKYPTPPKTGEIDTSKTQPKYMAWYKKNREEMERKRAELLATDDEEQLPRWLRRSMRNQKSEKDDRKVEKPSQKKTADTTPRTRRKVKPLVNVESEQLKAIVRQGRKLRRAEGGKNEDPPVQIFATTPPAVPQDPKHHLLQHSEYKYEKMPVPFYLHPPPAPHPSPQLSPEHFEIPPTVEHRTSEDFDSGIAVSLQQGGNRLRHQQLLEKKSVFDIAYSEAAPSQLRSDSTSPPS